MRNRIDLGKFNVRSDLVIDNIDKSLEKNSCEIYEYKCGEILVSRVIVDDKNSNILNKKEGMYVTIEFKDITNYEDREEVGKVLEMEINNILDVLKIKDNDECLIVGLGNDKSTVDSLGPLVISNSLVTRHLFEIDENMVKDGIRSICAFVPGVMGNTGIESSDIICSIVEKIKPKFVIVIDALASSSIERINKTIQITDSGISPGSGIGNNRTEISIDTIGIPVIAIGVPTVVDASTVVFDAFKYLYKHISYIKNNYNKNKLVFSRINYLDKIKDNNLSKEEKSKIGGMLGELDDRELKSLFEEVLNCVDYNMMVTVKEIDFVIDKLALVISSAINNSLSREISNF